MKLLIDECLSPSLAKVALERGHESTHVTWRKRSGDKDWELVPLIVEEDWTFVTKNSVDFRGPEDAPGANGEYAKLALHAGLICLNGPVGMDRGLQLDLFAVALDELAEDGDLVNQVLEITCGADGIHILRYALPPDDG